MMKKKHPDILSILIVFAGILVLSYPFISNYLKEKNASQAIGSYEGMIEDLDEEKARQMIEEARAYNQRLLIANGYQVSGYEKGDLSELKETYWKVLNVNENGMIGYLSIPRLGETLPFYHGSAEEVLQVGIGHLEYTSFPVGGESTHAALSGHRGLTSAKLFTDLDQVRVGDKFYLHILSETLAYQVDQILVVEPDQMEELAVQEGKDYVTLVTCTPYGINSHRLLVRGTRIPYVPAEEAQEMAGKAFYISRQYLYPMIGAGVLLLFFLIRKILSRKSRKKKVGG
jgi:sortase A